jgi:hypothetical protein
MIDRIVSQFVRSECSTRRDRKWDGRRPSAQVYDFDRAVAIARPKLVLLMDHENAGWSGVKPAPLVSAKAADGIQKFIVFSVDYVDAAASLNGGTL